MLGFPSSWSVAEAVADSVPVLKAMGEARRWVYCALKLSQEILHLPPTGIDTIPAVISCSRA
jgi:hypothetical protein